MERGRTRERCAYECESNARSAAASRVPTEEGEVEGHDQGQHPRQVWWGGVPREGAEGAAARADGGVCRVLSDGTGHQRQGAGEGEIKVPRRWYGILSQWYLHYTNNTISVVYTNNHTAVWGSWYDPASSQWGYACCHSTIHLSYCTGEAGIEAAKASSAKNLLASSSASPPPQETRPAQADSVEDRQKKAEELFSKKRLGEGEITLDKNRLEDAIREERKRKAKGDDRDDRLGKRKKAGQDGSHEVSQEELGAFSKDYVTALVLTSVPEAYRMTRRMTEDPMANYIDTEA